MAQKESNKALDAAPVRVLTQSEAHAEFFTRGYDTYDPCIVIAGTQKSIARDIKVVSHLEIAHGKGTEVVPLNAELGDWVTSNSILDMSVNGVSEDVTNRYDYRLVVWK